MNFIILFGIAAAAFCQTNAAVNVTLYYESLCSDTIRFVKNQLWPTYKSLGDNLKIDFIPFGKANWTENPWSITCQHGPRECHGNAVQACALERYKQPEMQVSFVSCVMMESQPDKAGATCAKRLGYKYDGIEECATGEEGKQLHRKYGKMTHGFTPRITFIPTVAFNNIYNAKDQEMALSQFKKLVCSKFPEGQKPPACNPFEPVQSVTMNSPSVPTCSRDISARLQATDE